MKKRKIIKTILGFSTICSLFLATSCIAQGDNLTSSNNGTNIVSSSKKTDEVDKTTTSSSPYISNNTISSSTSSSTTSNVTSSPTFGTTSSNTTSNNNSTGIQGTSNIPSTSTTNSIITSTSVTSSSIVSSNTTTSNQTVTTSSNATNKKQLYTCDYATLTKCGYYAQYLGNYQRNIPTQCQDEGLSVYPKFGETLTNVTSTQKQAILDEAEYLMSNEVYLTTANTDGSKDNGGYNRIDENGYLYLDNDKVYDKNGLHRQLYKHTASEGMYFGDVSDSEPGIIKRITFAKRSYIKGYGITGLYAPAGEVIKVEISGTDMKNTDGITLHIGQALYNGTSNNIIMSRDFTRMPHILNTLSLNKDNTIYNKETDTYTGYIGSYLGGAIYVRNESVDFSVTISGGVRYSHFILGYTTQAEFEQNAASSAPYFDLEVWDTGVLHSGPKKYASSFSYDDLYKVAVLWDKIAQISTQVTTQGILCFYDPHVTAGAACAFPGRGSVNCPTGWMVGSLDYDTMVTSGSWGNLHEYNHNFQRLHSTPWGAGSNNDVVEVTNNLLNLIAYGLYTEVSASRQIGTVSEGLSSWNRYTSPSWSLREITESRFENGKLGLSLYSNLYHNFGEDLTISCINSSKLPSNDDWFNTTMNVTGYDMTYYMKDLIGLEISQSVLTTAKGKGYPMFVPVSSIYQTGRSYTYNNKTCYTNTATPYRIAYGEAYTLDLSRYITNGDDYVSGSIVIPDGFSYTIKNITSPKNGTLTKNSDYNYTYTSNDATLSGKIYVTLSVTKDDKAFDVEDITLVFEFENSKELNKYTLERTAYTFDSKTKYMTAKAAYEAGYDGYISKTLEDNINPTQNCSAEIWFTSTPNPYQTIELNGKYYIEEAGKYRIALRGRFSVALYVSLDGINYSYCASYENNSSGSPDFPLTEGTYKDYVLEENSYLYFKAVLKCWDSMAKNSFIGVGLGKFDSTGNVNVNYVNAYRNDYEVTGSYTSDYVYIRDHTYTYKENDIEYTHSSISAENYKPYNSSKQIENLIDKDKENIYHSPSLPLDETPLILTLDMGKEVEANRILLKGFYPYPVPNDLKLEVSSDGINYTEIDKTISISNYRTTVDFSLTTFRYYRLTITSSTDSNNKNIILQDIELYKIVEFTSGHQITLDSKDVSLYGDFMPSYDSLSTFGHSYNATKDDYILYEFEGTRFAIKSNDLNADFTVIIDGTVFESIDLLCVDAINVIFMSDKLSSGNHTVKIVFNDNSNIDSLIYFD